MVKILFPTRISKDFFEVIEDIFMNIKQQLEIQLQFVRGLTICFTSMTNFTHDSNYSNNLSLNPLVSSLAVSCHSQRVSFP